MIQKAPRGLKPSHFPTFPQPDLLLIPDTTHVPSILGCGMHASSSISEAPLSFTSLVSICPLDLIT